MKKLLTINPGSTSTKLAFFEDDKEVRREEIFIDAEAKKSDLMLDQLPSRVKSINDFIAANRIEVSELDMIVCRGGSMNGVQSGPYAVDEHVLVMLENAPRTQHASSMASFIGTELAKPYGIPVIFYDSPSASDAEEMLFYTGLPKVKRWASDHCLNSKAVAREIAEKIGKTYETSNMLVAHLGGGITFSFHCNGVMADTVEDDQGPMSPERSGRLPSHKLLDLCFSGDHTKQEIKSMIRGKGGLVAYLGVNDGREVEKKIAQGDEFAKKIYWYMSYQISKAIGEMSVVNSGKIDRIILTGGLAHSDMLTDWIIDRVKFLAPVEIVPGEREMQALADGGLRVLNGEEDIKFYRWLPEDCHSLNDVKEKYGRGETSSQY
ncbi:butyrate kinase [Photobacterium sp. DNB23_23_1]